MTQTDPHTENIEQRSGYNIEELQVMGEQLLSRIKELVHEGNVRKIIIKQEGNTILEIPLKRKVPNPSAASSTMLNKRLRWWLVSKLTSTKTGATSKAIWIDEPAVAARTISIRLLKAIREVLR